MISSDKSYERKCARKLRDGLTREDIIEKSGHIIKGVTATEMYQNAKNILTYVSTGSEADTFELIKISVSDGKCVYVPKVYGREMLFIQIHSVDELSAGSFGILEPVKDEPVWRPSKVCDACKEKFTDLCIMPGLAFDRDFNRIGYGGGFYDRFLADSDGIYRMALCFECQLFENLSAEDTDVKPDCIVTEKEILYNGQH